MVRTSVSALALGAAVVLFSGAASAQSYYGHDQYYGPAQHNSSLHAYKKNCNSMEQDNQLVGALIGGVAGGLLGDGVAADSVRGEGRILGALVGAVAGSEIGKQSVDCKTQYYSPNTGQDRYYNSAYRYDSPYYPAGRTREWRPNGDIDYRHHSTYGGNTNTLGDEALYGGRSDEYFSSGADESAKQCQPVTRVTYLPDGREVHEPATACRPMYYGDWDVDN